MKHLDFKFNGDMLIMRHFILDTDWWTDCDDAVAIRLLCNAHWQKKVNLLGININGPIDGL